LEARGEREGEKRIRVRRVAFDAPARERLGALERRVETDLHLRIGLAPAPLREGAIVDEELGLEDAQTVELREEKARRLGDWAAGIVGSLVLPAREGARGAVEVEAVQPAVAEVERLGRLPRVGGARRAGRRPRAGDDREER